MNETGSSSEGTDALLSFTVENAFSYQAKTTLSLAATRLAEKDARRDLALAGRKHPIGVLPAVGLFGANASGKSTMLKAMADMRLAVLDSFRNRNGISNIYHPFALDPQSRKELSSYAVDLIIDGVRWQYGFEINDTRVVEEYAFYFPKGRQALVFYRDRENLNFGAPLQSSDGRVLRQLSKENSLLLSAAEAIEYSHLLPLFDWFDSNLLYILSQDLVSRVLQTASMLHDEEFKARILALIRLADLGITDIKRTEPDPDMADRLTRAMRILEGDENRSEDGETIMVDDIRFEHRGNSAFVDLEPDYESTGTLIWVSLIGFVIDVLRSGSLLLIDELDSSLHPDLVAVLIKLFQDPTTNPHCAQIIFNAHDLTILNRNHSSFGRDQIWFTEKNPQGATNLYSLAEFRPQKNDKLYISYLKGKYGALPNLDLTEIGKALDFGGQE